MILANINRLNLRFALLNKSQTIYNFSTVQVTDGRPKRPMNAYLLYLKDERPTTLSGYEFKEFVKTASMKWKALSDSQKKPYQDKQQELRQKYQDEITSYKALLSKEEKEEMLNEFRQKKMKKQKRMMKKIAKASGIPKRPCTPYSFYVRSRFAAETISNTSQGAELMKDAASTWKLMYQHERKPYEEEAKQDKDRYVREMAEYVQRITAEGRPDILPVKYQKKAKAKETTTDARS